MYGLMCVVSVVGLVTRLISGNHLQLSALLFGQEVLPAIMTVACRPLRPVAVRLLNVDEREAMSSLVATLADFSVNFDLGHAQSQDATTMALLPPVHSVCCFPVRPVIPYGENNFFWWRKETTWKTCVW